MLLIERSRCLCHCWIVTSPMDTGILYYKPRLQIRGLFCSSLPTHYLFDLSNQIIEDREMQFFGTQCRHSLYEYPDHVTPSKLRIIHVIWANLCSYRDERVLVSWYVVWSVCADRGHLILLPILWRTRDCWTSSLLLKDESPDHVTPSKSLRV